MKATAATRAQGTARGARDLATRQRLLAVATRLFAERGFRHVTVRDICQAASANVAAVNYHFGDKERLYFEVVDTALDAVRKFADLAMSAPSDATPEQQLRHYVRAHLVLGPDSDSARRAAVIRELFRHEFAEPTGAASRLVKEALLPRLGYLGRVVKAVLGRAATAERVEACVMSIQAQCLLPVAAPVAFGAVKLRTLAERERLAEHVVRFSIAGMKARGRVRAPASS